jgi:hypothetical protein
MNVDTILDTMNRHQVSFLLIGGMNFLLRHAPVLTYDVDLWVADTPENLPACEQALVALDAQWGATDRDWGPVARRDPGWLSTQILFCLTSPHGAIDIFRRVKGLGDWQHSFETSACEVTAGGIPYRGLSDADMLQCQLALEANEQKQDRIAALKRALEEKSPEEPDSE